MPFGFKMAAQAAIEASCSGIESSPKPKTPLRTTVSKVSGANIEQACSIAPTAWRPGAPHRLVAGSMSSVQHLMPCCCKYMGSRAVYRRQPTNSTHPPRRAIQGNNLSRRYNRSGERQVFPDQSNSPSLRRIFFGITRCAKRRLMVILLEGKGSEWPIAIAISTVIPQDHAVSVAPGMRARHRSLTRDFADMGELATSSRAIVANAGTLHLADLEFGAGVHVKTRGTRA